MYSKKKRKKDIFDFLEDFDGHTDYNARIEAVAEEFNMSYDEAECFVWDFTLEMDEEV